MKIDDEYGKKVEMGMESPHHLITIDFEMSTRSRMLQYCMELTM